MTLSSTRSVLWVPLVLAFVNLACVSDSRPAIPRHYLLLTHPALNRLTIFDPAAGKIIGALPTQKLPHDMLVSRDGILYVVNSGAQCITTYDLRSPAFWSSAARFMIQDSANLYAQRTPSAMMGQHDGATESPDTAAWTTLNRDPVQALPPSFARTYLTNPDFPAVANPMHAKVGAFSHTTCYDCHDRSVGAKPFGPQFSRDSSEIALVHLKGRDITFLDARSMTVRRRIPLPIPEQYSPIELWVAPDQTTAFVTCRNEIGQSKPGRILVMDLGSGTLVRTITAGIYPWHLLPDSSGERLYVNNFQSSRISIIDVKRQAIVDSLIAQNGPSMMTFIPGRPELAVSCFYTDRVLFINLNTKQVVKTIDVDSNPTSLAFTPDGTTLSVLCGGESTLDDIDVHRATVTQRHRMLFGAYAFHRIDETP